jgi:rRNA biogenesis protein RRP5
MLAKGVWGTCRIYATDEKHGFWASARSDFCDDRVWAKCLHPVLSSTLSFQKMLKPTIALYDHRLEFFKNPSYTPLPGTLLLTYITGVTDSGVFVKASSKSTILVPTPEVSDNNGTLPVVGNPALVLITKHDGTKYTGSMRQSLISSKWGTSPLTPGTIVNGTIVEIKNQRAILKLEGCLLQGEMDKKNAEGADSEDGWWAEKFIKVG